MFSQETADRICARLAMGESLRAICRDEGMPAESTVRLWAVENTNGFAAQYARARDIGMDCIADEIIDIANTTEKGVKTVVKATGTETTEGDMIEHRRLKVDARKWYLSKLAPKKYGDRTTLAGDPDAPLLAQMTDEQLAARIAALQAKLGGKSG